MPALRQIGLRLDAGQLLPGGSLSYGADATLAGIPLSGIDVDFFVLGGAGMSAHHAAGVGAAVPALAGAFCVGAGARGIATDLDPWCFGPAQVARIGANLDRLSRGRSRLLLDFRVSAFADSVPEGQDLEERAAEMIDAVRAHWRGATAFAGRHYRTSGRIVGPRPQDGLPPMLLRLPHDVQGPAAALSDRIDGLLVDGPRPDARIAAPHLLECAIVVRRTAAEAATAAADLTLPRSGHPLHGTPAEVAKQLAARLDGIGGEEVVLCLPGLCADEVRLLADEVLPQLKEMPR